MTHVCAWIQDAYYYNSRHIWYHIWLAVDIVLFINVNIYCIYF
jgi:hypothetical protein